MFGRARPFLVTVGALGAVLMIQLTILNGLPLPGGGTPDLVLLAVICVGLAGGARPGIAAGFWFGLALDLAPPALTMPGQYALVLCLAGYAAGRLRRGGDASVPRAFAAVTLVTAVAIGAELAVAGLGMVLGPLQIAPRLLVPVLVSSVLYDIACIPLSVSIAVRVAAPGAREAGARWQARQERRQERRMHERLAAALSDSGTARHTAAPPRFAPRSGTYASGARSASPRHVPAPSLSRRRREPMFGGSSSVVTAVTPVTVAGAVNMRAARRARARKAARMRARRGPSAARMRARRGPSRLLRWTRRPGGRSAVWRIGSRGAGVLR